VVCRATRLTKRRTAAPRTSADADLRPNDTLRRSVAPDCRRSRLPRRARKPSGSGQLRLRVFCAFSSAHCRAHRGHSVASGSAGDVDGATTTDPSFWRYEVHLVGCRRAGRGRPHVGIDAAERSVVVRTRADQPAQLAPTLLGCSSAEDLCEHDAVSGQ
jgi:hypothetical protein